MYAFCAVEVQAHTGQQKHSTAWWQEEKEPEAGGGSAQVQFRFSSPSPPRLVMRFLRRKYYSFSATRVLAN